MLGVDAQDKCFQTSLKEGWHLVPKFPNKVPVQIREVKVRNQTQCFPYGFLLWVPEWKCLLQWRTLPSSDTTLPLNAHHQPVCRPRCDKVYCRTLLLDFTIEDKSHSFIF